MKKILLTVSGHQYLVGFANDLSSFLQKDHNVKSFDIILDSETHQIATAYHANYVTSVSYVAYEIQDGETCFYKAI